MLNTPEFWVLVAFVLCIPISIKWILPTLNQAVQAYQQTVEQAFIDAEAILLSAQKRVASAKEHLKTLPNMIEGVNADLEANINVLMQEWQEEQERLRQQYQRVQTQSLQHLKSHAEHAIYNRTVLLCAAVLHQHFSQHMTAKQHQQIVMASLKNLN